MHHRTGVVADATTPAHPALIFPQSGPRSISVPVDVPSLSGQARDGLACALCGRSFLEAEPVPSQPVGVLDGGQLFACVTCVEAAEARQGETSGDGAAARRPLWLAEPCPAWCDETHRDSDHPDDRKHWRSLPDVDLTQQPPVRAYEKGAHGYRYRPPQMQVCLVQPVREAAPVVLLTQEDHAWGPDMPRCTYETRLTLDEAADMADVLRAATVLGRDRTAEAARPDCEPWCVNHNDLDGASGGMCQAEDLGAGDGYGGVVGLTCLPGRMPRIHLDACEPLSVEDAERLALALLTQVWRSRTSPRIR